MRVSQQSSDHLRLTETPIVFWLFALLPLTIAIGSPISIYVGLHSRGSQAAATQPASEPSSEPSTQPGVFPTSVPHDAVWLLGIVGIHVLVLALGVAMLGIPYTRWDFDKPQNTLTRTTRYCFVIHRTQQWPLDSIASAQTVDRGGGDELDLFNVELLTRDGTRIPLSNLSSSGKSDKTKIVKAISDLLPP